MKTKKLVDFQICICVPLTKCVSLEPFLGNRTPKLLIISIMPGRQRFQYYTTNFHFSRCMPLQTDKGFGTIRRTFIFLGVCHYRQIEVLVLYDEPSHFSRCMPLQTDRSFGITRRTFSFFSVYATTDRQRFWYYTTNLLIFLGVCHYRQIEVLVLYDEPPHFSWCIPLQTDRGFGIIRRTVIFLGVCHYRQIECSGMIWT